LKRIAYELRKKKYRIELEETMPASATAKKKRTPPPKSPLGKAAIIGFAATTNPAKAKAFYRDALGLKLMSEDDFALVFDADGTMLRVQKVQKVSVSPYTSLGWTVSNIADKVKQLTNAGIAFERYPGMPQDSLGIWKSPAGAKIAWLKEPEGNIFSLTEF
jgi:catechol 2,3-dioxygenase-like lactoylglutathione lyase family enzyme